MPKGAGGLLERRWGLNRAFTVSGHLVKVFSSGPNIFAKILTHSLPPSPTHPDKVHTTNGKHPEFVVKVISWDATFETFWYVVVHRLVFSTINLKKYLL